MNVQHERAPGPKMFCCCGSAQVPHTNPFQQSTVIVVQLHDWPQPGACVGEGGIGVGDEVFVTVGLLVEVGERVRVGLMVHVRVMVLVLHGVQETVRVAGQVIVGVGVSGTAQQMFSST